MDKVNVGILTPINPVSNSENRRRLEHCNEQRNRADLKKLHYDGARMYHPQKFNKLKNSICFSVKFVFQSMKFIMIGYLVNTFPSISI